MPVDRQHRDRPDRAAHPPAPDHHARDPRQLLDVGLGAGGQVAEHDLLGDARPPSATLICASRWRSSKLKRSASGAEKVTPSAWPRGMIETLRTGSAPGGEHPDDRVAGLVVGGPAAVLVGDHDAALGAEHDPLERVGEVLAVDLRVRSGGRRAARPR